MVSENEKKEMTDRKYTENLRKRIQVETKIIDNKTSAAMWRHQPRTQKFKARIDVQLLPCDDERDDIDFNSPELGKLCEKFLKL